MKNKRQIQMTITEKAEAVLKKQLNDQPEKKVRVVFDGLG